MPDHCPQCGQDLTNDDIRCPDCLSFIDNRLAAAIDEYYHMTDVSDPDNDVYRKNETFHEKVQLVFPRLEDIAKNGKTASQTPIQGDGVDLWGIKYYLGAVSSIEHWDDRPLLSSVIINAEQGYPSEGYFILIEKLDGLPCNITDWTEDEQVTWWQNELQDVHNYWTGR